MAIATIAAEREQVLVAPPINFGVSPYFRKYANQSHALDRYTV
jgi:hypothetical protein